MTRGQIVELMARASWEHEWPNSAWDDEQWSIVEAYLRDAEAVLDGIEAAGLEIVPRDEGTRRER